MRSHELAEMLLDDTDKEITASVDISTCDEDSGDRVFGEDFCGINPIDEDSVALLFSSYHINYSVEQKEKEYIRKLELVLHTINSRARIAMDVEKTRDLIDKICNWSYSHRQGNGEYTEEEQNECINRAFSRLIKEVEGL